MDDGLEQGREVLVRDDLTQAMVQHDMPLRVASAFACPRGRRLRVRMVGVFANTSW
jgi:hypothetical protein